MKLRVSHIFIPGLLLLIFFSACSNRPSWVLSDKKMVDVLYDMNLAESEIEANYDAFRENGARQKLLNTVLEKHKITKQDFDTSLVWYNAHLELYFKICDKVNKRYATDTEQLQKKIDEENRLLAERSRANIYKGKRNIFLQAASQLQNTISFNVDSIKWSSGDSLEVSFDVLGLNKGVKPDLLCYVFCEDTVILQKEKILANGNFSKLMPEGMNKVKRVSVSIHISDSIPNPNILINKFGIFLRKNQGNATVESPKPI